MVVQTTDFENANANGTARDGTEAPGVEPGSATRKRGGGPQSIFGRERSRANSLKEGLNSKVVFTQEMTNAILEKTNILTEEFKPETPYERMIIGEMAIARAKLEHASRLIIEDIDRPLFRALNFWEYDQKTNAIKMRTRLAKHPERIANALAGSKAGADLCIGYWSELAAILDSTGDWNEQQRRLAFDLLGICIELRSGSTRVPPVGDKAGLAAVAAGEIARLRQAKGDLLDDLDISSQADAAAGRPLEDDAKTKSLQRKEKGDSRRDFYQARDELLRSRAAAAQAEKEREDQDDDFGLEPPHLFGQGHRQEMEVAPWLVEKRARASAAAAESKAKNEAETAAVAETVAVAEIETVNVAEPTVVAPTTAATATTRFNVTPTTLNLSPSLLREGTLASAMIVSPPQSRRGRKAVEKRLRLAAHREVRKKGTSE